MALLILIAVAQLVVSVLLLAVILQEVTRQQIERAAGPQAIRGAERQTVHDMFQASEADSVTGRGHAGQGGRS